MQSGGRSGGSLRQEIAACISQLSIDRQMILNRDQLIRNRFASLYHRQGIAL
jgi:hypothetical protein